MFFILSKILAFIISPVNWIVFALIFGVLTKNKRRKRRSYIAAVILFFVFSNAWLAGLSMRIIEEKTIGHNEIDHTYEAGILLGGMIHYQSDSNLVSFNSNGDRLFQTIALYHSNVIDKVIISSGSGMLQLPSFKESYLIKKYMVDIGIPSEDILIETNSRNTYENAVETRKVLDAAFGPVGDEEYLLITSASHMRRAAACFRKQGINVIPYSTTKRGYRPGVVFNQEMILPSPEALGHWRIINHELIGYFFYRLSGKL